MKQTVNLYQFRDAFQRMDRGDAFSYEGLEILFKGLEEYEEDTNEEMELDVIALCCDFSEMHYTEILRQYNIDFDDVEDDALDDAIQAYLEQNTWLLGKTDSGNYVFRQF
jgi:hypothetical protein